MTFAYLEEWPKCSQCGTTRPPAAIVEGKCAPACPPADKPKPLIMSFQYAEEPKPKKRGRR